jgi:hypothetical protein
MKLTAGHDCAHTGCEGLAVFGFNFKDQTQWACARHRSEIGFTDRPAMGHNAMPPAGLQVGPASLPPAAAHQQKQARLL